MWLLVWRPKPPLCSQVQGQQPNEGVQPFNSRPQQQKPRQSQRGTSQLLRCLERHLKR
uniref:Uncharacterized protein n=1 Tax=Arundo donax TaxID=35708 RepID=A0A0A9FPE9_ARUDO